MLILLSWLWNISWHNRCVFFLIDLNSTNSLDLTRRLTWRMLVLSRRRSSFRSTWTDIHYCEGLVIPSICMLMSTDGTHLSSSTSIVYYLHKHQYEYVSENKSQRLWWSASTSRSNQQRWLMVPDACKTCFKNVLWDSNLVNKEDD